MNPEIQPVEHGVETACYAGGPGEPYYQPAMECMCGWGTGRCKSWQTAGRKFDEHLRTASRQPQSAPDPQPQPTEPAEASVKH
jgi:hypothetical protein